MAKAKAAAKSANKKAKKATAKTVKKSSQKTTNKLGVKNSLVNNINARKKEGISRSKKKSDISKENYNNMEKNWGKNK